jgi:uncharacterized protein YbjT (DUF2867 family)
MSQQAKVAVAGGTGTVGRHVVASLRHRGVEPVVLARSRGVDITTGTGLADALVGTDAVIDVSGVSTSRGSVATAFFEQATKRLLAEGRRAGVRHHVVLSIVGCDRTPLGYYGAKQRQEELVLAGDVPGTVLRATQFHEFAGQMLGRGVGPLTVVPRMRIEPVAAQEVAEELVSLALGAPAGLAPELAGPKEELLPDMVRRLLRARGLRRVLLALRLPGAGGRAMARGTLMSRERGRRGVVDFDQWLGGADGDRQHDAG